MNKPYDFLVSEKQPFLYVEKALIRMKDGFLVSLNIGDVPKRVVFQIIRDLKLKVNRGTSIEVYIQDKSAYHGFKLVQIGKVKNHVELFTLPSKIDTYLIAEGVLKKSF